MATSYLKSGNICADLHAPISKVNYMQAAMRQQFDNPDKKLSENKEEDPLRLIERCARTGSWVLISTIRFPQFRQRVCTRLEQMRQENLIDDQFRIIFDLQGYSQADIADSFLSDGAISFHMTEQNTEEFEGFDDIWSAILDERVLIKLTEKVEALRAKAVADALPQARTDLESKSDDVSDSGSSAARRKDAAPESPSNFKLIDNTIKSEVQKALYKQFMHESKVEN